MKQKNSVVNCYVDNLIDNTDGKFDKMECAWFIVPTVWLELQVVDMGDFKSLEHFYTEYTYDDTDGLLQKAVDEGVLLGCGAGLIEFKEVAE